MKISGILLLFLLSTCSLHAQYPRIGELIENRDGSKGVVFWVRPDGSGGWMVALDDIGSSSVWGELEDIPELENVPYEAPDRYLIKGLSDTNGYRNTAILRQLYQSTDQTYAAQLVDFENGWYIPSLGQAYKLKMVWPTIRSKIILYGGKDLTKKFYWTSTEEDWQAVRLMYGGDKIFMGRYVKKTSVSPEVPYIRPIRSFNNTNLTYQWSTGETTPSITVQPEKSGDYRVTIISAEGWTSTALKHITVPPSYLLESNASIADGESYPFRGKDYSIPGIYDDSLKTVNGCDSIYRLHLSLGQSYLYEETASICQGETFDFRGHVLSLSGIYSDSLKTVNGMDSVFQLTLKVNPIYFFPNNATICEGDRYDFRGQLLTQPGIYYDSLKTTSGCDSVYQLKLSVNQAYLFTQDTSICAWETYPFKDRPLTQPGIYDDSLTTIAGCDSIYRLHLHIKSTDLFPEAASICQGGTYEFRGKTYSQSGIYYDTLKNQPSCSIYQLDLKVIEPAPYIIKIESEDCRTHTYRFEAYSESSRLSEYHWNFGDGISNSTSASNTLHSYADSGSYQINLIVTTETCPSEYNKTLYVPYFSEQFDIEATPTKIDILNPVVTFRTRCISGLTYHWEFGDGTSAKGCQTEHRYTVTENSSFYVILSVTNSEQCQVEKETEITTFMLTQIPNTFSPNGDGINDTFMEGYRVKIMDRNGQSIFEGENGWDGTYKGKPAKQDVYFYEIFRTHPDNPQKQTGYITLIK